MPANASPPHRPAIFGEVLYDCFPDGQEVLGGAPFNVAWHLQALGLEPLMISRVGSDTRGKRILARMSSWGLCTDGIQRDPTLPTGTVQVRIEDGQNRFSIPPDQAFDQIDLYELTSWLPTQELGLIYHGTLALRASASQDAWRALLRDGDAQVFCDINLREPWTDARMLDESLRGATWVKLNEDELTELGEGRCGPDTDCARRAQRLRERFDLRAVIVTRGGEGALAVDERGARIDSPAERPEPFVDSVGAGDAFSAVCIMGLAQGWTLDTILRRASTFAARICQIRGATSEDISLYHDVLAQWKDESRNGH
jgi:fructokinase